MIRKIIVVCCCLFLVNMLQSVTDMIFGRNRIFTYTKGNKIMNILDKRQYKILKHLKDYQDQRVKKNSYKDLDNIILGNDFYESIDMERFEVNTILKELHNDSYIYDVASVEPQFTKVHTCKIEDRGLDALKNYQEGKENEVSQIDKKEKNKHRNFVIEKMLEIVSGIIKIITKLVGVYVIILIIENW